MIVSAGTSQPKRLVVPAAESARPAAQPITIAIAMSRLTSFFIVILPFHNILANDPCLSRLLLDCYAPYARRSRTIVTLIFWS